jgi:hypothetical protein
MKVNETPDVQPSGTTTPSEPFKQIFEKTVGSAPTMRVPNVASSSPTVRMPTVPGRPQGASAARPLYPTPPPMAAGTPPVLSRGTGAPLLTATNKTVQIDSHTLNRLRITAEADRLSEVRAQHAEVAQTRTLHRSEQLEGVSDKLNDRVVDLIANELVTSMTPPPAQAEANNVVPINAYAAGAQQERSADPKTRSEQATALIEKIETFVKSQRPALALTLNNSLGLKVEIERLGPKEVALRLVGHRGPPTPDTVARIREEITARGLKVGALSIE